MKIILNDFMELLAHWFESITSYHFVEERGKKPIWLIIENLPSYLWNKATFQRIGGLWGRVIKVSSFIWKRFNNARVLILIRKRDTSLFGKNSLSMLYRVEIHGRHSGDGSSN